MSWIQKVKSKVSKDNPDQDYLEGDYTDDYTDPSGAGIGSKVGGVLTNLFLIPIKSLMGLAHNTGVEIEYEERTFGEKVRSFLKKLILFPFKVIIAPFEFIRILTRSNLREVLFILPALLVISLFGFVLIKILISGKDIERQYAQGAVRAYEAGDLTKAKTYFKRLIQKQEVSQERQFQWAMILADTGEPEKAGDLIEKMAPNDEIGYGPAHKLRALAAVRELPNKANDPTVLERLSWHLKNCRDESPEIQQAWAAYHTQMDDFDSAIAALEKASETTPKAFELIARIENGRGNKEAEQQALAQAEKAYRAILKKEPHNQQVLIELASVLTNLGRYAEAERLLSQGLRQKTTPQIRRASAAFYVRLFEVAVENEKPITDQMNLLIRSLQLDPNFGPTYERMMRLYMLGDGTDEDKAKIKESLVAVVTSDQPTPMAHLSLSNFLWEEGEREKATFHLEQAYRMDPGFVVVLNNLAWMLAHAESPDLGRALELSEKAVKERPADSRFRDTLGTILLKMGRHNDAIPELQLALNNSGAGEKLAIHAKLAVAYDKIGMDDLAKIHQKNSYPPNGR